MNGVGSNMTIAKQVMIPVDDDGYLRRECPYCIREFKITKNDFDGLDVEKEYSCPYCGQTADPRKWWTQDQKALFMKVVSNVATDILNETFVKHLRSLNNPSAGITVNAKDLDRGNEIINPEINDMKIIGIPCCQKSVKILGSWTGSVYCYYCGFRHHSIKTKDPVGDQ
jgi:uncharacterized Zn-finger protein